MLGKAPMVGEEKGVTRARVRRRKSRRCAVRRNRSGPGQAANEADVSAATEELQLEIQILARNLANLGEDLLRQEGIVDCAEKECRAANALEEAQRARSRVVVVRVPKAVHGRGHDIVEVIESPRAAQGLAIEQARIPRQLRGGLPPEGAEKVTLVETRETSRDVARAALQIVRHGNGCRSAHAVGERLTALAEPLEQHISAERDPAEQDRRGGKLLENPTQRKGEVGGLAGMIESRGLIRLRSAAPKEQ